MWPACLEMMLFPSANFRTFPDQHEFHQYTKKLQLKNEKKSRKHLQFSLGWFSRQSMQLLLRRGCRQPFLSTAMLEDRKHRSTHLHSVQCLKVRRGHVKLQH